MVTPVAAVVEATEVEDPVEAVPTEATIGATIEIDDFKRQNSVTQATCILLLIELSLNKF